MESGVRTVTLTEERFDAQGRPTYALRNIQAGSARTRVEIRFSAQGAAVALGGFDSKEYENHPLPKGWTLDDPARGWFVDRMPTVGASASVARFSLDTLDWTPLTLNYVGTERLPLRGRQVIGHKVVWSTGRVCHFDFQGVPLRTQQSGADGVTVIERVSGQ